jgi:KaiC/GvpD/RAD55 family RecA-like ATPase
MLQKGYGKYPYPCTAQDKHPQAMIYEGCTAGHTGWTVDLRDELCPGRKDTMNTPLNPVLRTALENIIDNITDAENDTQDNINYSNALPLDTEELTEALRTAKEALKTARLIAEDLITARHLDQR